MHAAMVIAVGFALIILAGALLLMLPCAAKSGRATLIDALFTATSATCVTGLVTVSTAVHWSVFGKCVIPAADPDRRPRLYVGRDGGVVCAAANHHAARTHGHERGLQSDRMAAASCG